jgi:DNA-binding CsgD family transcriptional regulator
MQVLRLHGPVLSERQSKILQMSVDGHSKAQIAQQLGLDETTIGADLAAVIQKLIDLLRDIDAIKGDAVTSPAVYVDDDSSLSDSWDPQIRLILLDHGGIAVTLDRPATSAGHESG